MKIVADPNIPFVAEAFGRFGEVRLVHGREITPDTVRDADLLLVRSVTPVNRALLENSRVRFVATATIGFDHVDREYLSQERIGFTRAEGSNANSVAEYVVAAMLSVAESRKFRLRGKTLGVIGVGNVGSRVVRYAEGIGMRVLQNDPPRQRAENLPHFVSLDRVLAEADVITLHVPLAREGEDATFHLFDKGRLDALEDRKPVLVNTARGAVLDNQALLKAIDGERLGGIVLDVWENEPGISPELLDVVDIGTPHIAGYSFDGKVNGVRMIYEAACEYFKVPREWTPKLPPPPIPQLRVLVEPGTDDEDALHDAVRRVYDITADDAALRNDIRSFDKLRAQYPVRREFFNTELVLRGATEALRSRFAGLGFRTAS